MYITLKTAYGGRKAGYRGNASHTLEYTILMTLHRGMHSLNLGEAYSRLKP